MEAKESPYYLGNRECLPTVLSIKTSDKVVTVELPWDASLEDMLDAFYGALVSITYHPNSVLGAMYNYSNERLSVKEKESYE